MCTKYEDIPEVAVKSIKEYVENPFFEIDLKKYMEKWNIKLKK